MSVTEVSTPMSLSNTEEKEWLSTVILGSLNRTIHKLKPEDRPTWAKVDIRDFLTPIVSAVVNDQAWPDVLESCRRCAAVQNLPEDESDHVLVVVEDVLALGRPPEHRKKISASSRRFNIERSNLRRSDITDSTSVQP
jgi:hypothetical protein